jgi:N-carbamoyl-L-amino-acid hydrolase
LSETGYRFPQASKIKMDSIRVNEARMRANFEALSAVGATPEGGVHRPALSRAHLEARRWFGQYATQAGFDLRVDSAGNHSARLRCGRDGAKALLLGSHLDSVPQGGRYDGALGVLCALEVLQTIHEAGLSLSVDLEAIDLIDEEGAYVGLLGSRALTGRLSEADLTPHAGREAFEAALQGAGLTREGILWARRDPASLAGYLEVHVEQGPRLALAGTDIGVVTDIVGIRWYRLRFVGEANHSGTTPMAQRRDAAQGASAFALVVRETVMSDFEGCVANVGKMDFAPGAFNIVPAMVDVSLEFRSSDVGQLERLDEALIQVAQAQAERFDLDLKVKQVEAISPAPMDPDVRQVIHESADALGLTHVSMASGAGHDAQSFAGLCPVGMVFVPSVGGISHSPREYTRWEDCVNGANVLLHAAIRLASESEQ